MVLNPFLVKSNLCTWMYNCTKVYTNPFTFNPNSINNRQHEKTQIQIHSEKRKMRPSHVR